MTRDHPRRERFEGVRVARADRGAVLVRHRNGDRDAFAELVDEYRRPIYSYLNRCGVAEEDGKDLFQEIFLRIHRGAGSYREGRPLHPWIFTIVANAVRTHLRRRQVRELTRATSAAPEPVDEAPGPERVVQGRQAITDLEAEIARLSPVQRQVLLLVSVENLALKQVAESLELPVNTVKTHLRRARLALAVALDRRGAGDLLS